jgi:hypothetical protein
VRSKPAANGFGVLAAVKELLDEMFLGKGQRL